MQFTVTGEIDENGDLGIYNMNQLKDLCRKNKNKRLIVTFQIEEKGSKNAMLKYYYAKVVPEWKQEILKMGMVMTNKEVDNYIRTLSPITESKSLSELNKEEMMHYLDHVRKESLGINLVIEEPRCL